jgi:hypothetical protein
VTARRKKLLIALLVALGGCGVGLYALVPSAGPPLLAALPPGDVLVKADDVDGLWRLLEESPRFARLMRGEAVSQIAKTAFGRGVADALEQLEKRDLVSRSRASHLVGREAGVSLSFTDRGAIAHWVAAFRIDTVARIVELAAGRVVMGGQIARSERDGVAFAALTAGSRKIYWCRLGDLLVAASDESRLRAAVTSARAASGAASDDADAWSPRWSERFDLAGLPDRSDGFRVGLRLDHPEDKLAAALRLSARDRQDLAAGLRAVGLPAPVDAVSISLQLRDGEILEDDFLRGKVSVPASGESAPERRPEGAFLWWQFRPGRAEAIQRAWHVMRYLRPPRGAARHAGWETFSGMVQARLGPEVAMALAEQKDVDAPTGGFPAEFLFFRLVGAESMREMLEDLLRQRSLGIFAHDAVEPVRYPYLVRHRVPDAWIYEMVIRNTRRQDGYRPSLAVSGSNLVYSSSLPALKRYLAGAGATRSPAGRAWVESLEGPDVFALDWRTPSDLRALKNAYDYLTELRRFAPPATAKVLSEQIDYEALWRAAEEVLGQIARQQRLGVRTEDGMRMRARWVLAPQ